MDIAGGPCYRYIVLKSFKDEGTESIFNGRPTHNARMVCQVLLWGIASRKFVINATNKDTRNTDMLGFGNTPNLLVTREVEEALLDGINSQRSGDESWIISPYTTIDKLGTIRRAITEACKRGVRVNYVVRDEPDQVSSAKAGLKEACENGLELFALHRLHAKLYWFQEEHGIVTSANLVEGSFEASTELGVFVPFGGLHDDLRKWISEEIEPRLRPISEATSSRPKSVKNSSSIQVSRDTSSSKSGYCIRCAKEIPMNSKKPYCLAHYRSWARYENPEYQEKHCHFCGAITKASMVKPKCYSCYKAEGS